MRIIHVCNYISDVTQIVSLIQGVLYAKLCSAKYIILNSKMESCYSGFTHKVIIRLKLLHEQHTVLTVKSKKKRLKARWPHITPALRWGHHFFGIHLYVSSGGDSENIQANKRLYIYDVYFWNSNVFVNGCIYMYVYILVCTPRCLWKEASGWKLTQMPEEKRSCEVCVPALLSAQHSMSPL